jgi:predicted RNA-binding Zn-ribbon protein involved in translation (DUF1610 family)
LEETQLRYSASVVKNRAATNPEYDVDIPEIVLHDITADTASKRRDRGSPSSDAARAVSGSEKTVPNTEQEGAADCMPEASPATQPVPPLSEKETRSEVDEPTELPSFDDNAGSTVSRTVDPAFHHHARHTAKQCPGCGEATLFRSRSRTFSENVKKRFTSKRLYRCHRCGWRGWMSRGF